MKYLDILLKKLKTDRNTFFTYILSLISIYIVVDRLPELLFIIFTGLSVSYWGPIKYTFAILCVVFAYNFSPSSKFIDFKKRKVDFFYTYMVVLYILVVSMIIQWINQLGWILLFSVPNYSYIITNFMDIIKPAFSAIAWYIPLISFYPLFKWLYFSVNDTLFILESLWDYGGIDLSKKSDAIGPYTCEMLLCKDTKTGEMIYTPEARRFESTAVIGVSGSGKTSMVFEPMIARDMEKKYFLKETSKELAYTALKTNIATLSNPYSNDYINSNFSLNMIIPSTGKEKVFKAFFSKLTYHYDGDKSVYKNLGVTYLAPDIESVNRLTEVADNFGIKYNLIDPSNPEASIGLNPFSYKDPIKTSIAISAILKRIYFSDVPNHDEAYMRNVVSQAIENLVLLLKEMYPRLHDGDLPSLEDLFELINDYSLIEEMAEQMKEIPGLHEKYKVQLAYFKKTFYKTASGQEETTRLLSASAAQLDNLLRYPGVKAILCNRTHNINYDDALKNGEVTFVCTRRGELGPNFKAFGLFFILLMQQSVLTRPGNERSRIPHFFYIDEFPSYICKATEDIFTIYRKYRVGTVISAQNLSQFGNNEDGVDYKQTILANCTTKIVFGNNTPEDNEWWEQELGEKRRWQFTHDFHTNTLDYDENYKGVKYAWVKNYKAGKVQSLKFKAIIYKTKDVKGTTKVGGSKVDFLESKYKEEHKIKTFNFSKFNSSGRTDQEDLDSDEKFSLKNIKFKANPNNPNDMEPIKFNNTDVTYEFDSDNALTSYNSKRSKKPKKSSDSDVNE